MGWHGRAGWHGVAVPLFCLARLGFVKVHGLNAFEVWFEYKPFGEVGTMEWIEMEVNGVEE